MLAINKFTDPQLKLVSKKVSKYHCPCIIPSIRFSFALRQTNPILLLLLLLQDYLLMDPKVRPVNGSQLVDQMKHSMEAMLNKKKQAVQVSSSK